MSFCYLYPIIICIPNMVKVVIPIYKTALNKYEEYSLCQCFSILGEKYPIIFIKPESLDISPLYEKYAGCFEVECFEDKYFESVKSYNQLMLSSEFYERFLDVKYILIYQTDALVFRDELEKWCGREYDYIGAPWIPKVKYLKGIGRMIWLLRLGISHISFTSGHAIQREYKVGNGGLSLRNTRNFHEVTKRMVDLVTYYKENCDKISFNEDIFWGVEVNKHGAGLRIPSYKEALRFSIEMYPESSYILGGEQLPFGTHAWSKAPYDRFWKHFIDFDKLNDEA